MKKLPYILLVFILTIAYSHAQQLSVNDELILPNHNQKDAYYPSIAKGDSNYLVVWQSGFNENSSIVGMRLNLLGDKTDQTPFAICDAADAQEQPRVAYNNGTFLVVWSDLRNGKDYDVYGARIAATDGTVIDPNGVIVAEGSRNQKDPYACSNGDGFVIAWRTFKRDSSALYMDSYLIALRYLAIDGSFSAVDTIPFVKVGSNTEINSGAPVLLPLEAGKTFLAFSSVVNRSIPRRTISFRLIENGKSIAANIIGSGLRLGHEISVATDGNNITVVWGNFFVTGGRGGAVDGGMALVSPSSLDGTIAITNPYPSAGGNRPAVAWDGYSFILGWQSAATSGSISYDNILTKSFSSSRVVETSEKAVAGTANMPASNQSYSSDGNGRTVVVYESHPAVATTPIGIGVRVITNPNANVASEIGSSTAGVLKMTCSPNPFNSAVEIRLSGLLSNYSENQKVVAEIFTLSGKKIAVLLPTSTSMVENSGVLSYSWEKANSRMAEGVYVVKIKVANKVLSRRILRMNI